MEIKFEDYIDDLLDEYKLELQEKTTEIIQDVNNTDSDMDRDEALNDLMVTGDNLVKEYFKQAFTKGYNEGRNSEL